MSKEKQYRTIRVVPDCMIDEQRIDRITYCLQLTWLDLSRYEHSEQALISSGQHLLVEFELLELYQTICVFDFQHLIYGRLKCERPKIKEALTNLEIFCFIANISRFSLN